MSNVAVASDSLQMSQQARSQLAAEGVAGRFRESKGRQEVCGMDTARGCATLGSRRHCIVGHDRADTLHRAIAQTKEACTARNPGGGVLSDLVWNADGVVFGFLFFSLSFFFFWFFFWLSGRMSER